MANAKQDGSNLLNAEYHTARCKTLCEQCFVNFGQQGTATCLGSVNREHGWLLGVAGDASPCAGRPEPR